MHKNWVRFMLTVLVVGLLTAGAFAAPTQISIGGGTGSVTFTSVGTTGQVKVSFGAINGTASWQINNVLQGTGNFSITPGGPMSATIQPDGSWIVNPSGHTLGFTFTAGGESLTGNILLSTMTDGTGAPPAFTGTLNVVSSAGSAAFTGLFPAGANLYISFDFSAMSGTGPFTVSKAGIGTTLINPSFGQGGFSGGEIHPVPEPSSIALLGAGLVGLGGFLRRRIHG